MAGNTIESHWGIPGPGGSMGKCAVCGEDFIAGVLMDLMGLPSGISQFTVGFIEQTLYAHDPKCKDIVKKVFASEEPQAAYNELPDGPLKKCLGEAIMAQENPDGR